jgi:hypothetical protein
MLSNWSRVEIIFSMSFPRVFNSTMGRNDFGVE